MALVPSGPFVMGSLAGESDERPVHPVMLDVFYIDVYEVTNSRYAECVQAGVCAAPAENGSSLRANYYDKSEFGNYPVIYVNWVEATAYCAWRGARLPSEAEWEKAARGGEQDKRYPWGDDSPVCNKPGALSGANFAPCSPDDTTPVGRFGPNGYGLYDMAGNVWEWVGDYYGSNYYYTHPAGEWPADPTGPETGGRRVLRGGGWFSEWTNLRVSARFHYIPDARSHNIGFRCVRDP